MIRIQTQRIQLARARPGWTLHLPVLPGLSALLAVLLALALLVAIYHAPYKRVYDVGSWIASAEQVYDIEEANGLAYAYSKGDSTLRFHELGQAGYDVALQLAGPGGSHPLNARVDAGYGWLSLGSLEGIRSVHLLATPGSASDLRIRIAGETALVAPDTRPLGVMLGRVAVESLSSALPPPSIAFAAGGALALLWLALTLLGWSTPRRMVVLALGGVGLIVSAALGRGQVMLVPLWLLLGASGLAASALIRGETNTTLASPRGVLVLFAAWRIALSVVAALALRFERAVYSYGYDNTFYHGSWLPERPTLWLSALFDTWMQWDALHYASIATSGYTFSNQRWPNIAFFPLYPVAIRALLPVVANNVTAAALLVAQLALLGAVLLLFIWYPASGARRSRIAALCCCCASRPPFSLSPATAKPWRWR